MQILMTYFELILTLAVFICLIFYIIDSKSYLKERKRLYKVFKSGVATDVDRELYRQRLLAAQAAGVKAKLKPFLDSASRKLIPPKVLDTVPEGDVALAPNELKIIAEASDPKRQPLYGKELFWTLRPVYRKEKFIEFFSGMFWVLFIIWLVRSFLWEPFQIPSASMEPTLQNGDFILTNKYSYGIRLPVLHTKIIPTGAVKRGDIVVFRWPGDNKTPYIKRIIGLPGDKVSVSDGMVTLNGQVQKLLPTGQVRKGHDRKNVDYIVYTEQLDGHPHLMELNKDARYRLTSHNSFEPFFAPQGETITVPEGYYFAMGDNRDDSMDSRIWGLVPDANLIGKATFIWANSDCIMMRGGCKRIGTVLQ